MNVLHRSNIAPHTLRQGELLVWISKPWTHPIPTGSARVVRAAMLPFVVGELSDLRKVDNLGVSTGMVNFLRCQGL